MSEAWIYVDESQGPHPTSDKSAPFWVASLVTASPIERELVDEAMASLRSDPDAAGHKPDAATLARGYFHGCLDSKNGHSALCRAIVKRSIDASFVVTQWHFSDDEERIQGSQLHRLATALSLVPMFQDDLDCLHIAIAPRLGSFVDVDLGQLLSFMREAHLRSAFEMPNLSTRFPAVDAKLAVSTEPGLQVVDFLLWAVQRSKPQKLAPEGDSTWLERVGLRLWAQYKIEGAPPGQIVGNLGNGFARFVPTPPSIVELPNVTTFTAPQRWQLILEIVGDVHRAASELDRVPRIQHLRSAILNAAELCQRAGQLRGEAQFPKVLTELVKTFLLVCDTWPMFDRKSQAAWVRAAEKRAIAGELLFGGGKLWVPRDLDLSAATAAKAK